MQQRSDGKWLEFLNDGQRTAQWLLPVRDNNCHFMAVKPAIAATTAIVPTAQPAASVPAAITLAANADPPAADPATDEHAGAESRDSCHYANCRGYPTRAVLTTRAHTYYGPSAAVHPQKAFPSSSCTAAGLARGDGSHGVGDGLRHQS